VLVRPRAHRKLEGHPLLVTLGFTCTDAPQRTGADFVYSILTWVLPERDGYADIPAYPDAPRPPEASVTLHRADVVQAIGFWRLPQETYSVPRADYFRRAQFAGKQFVLVPRLTVLKFWRWPVPYAAAGPQPEYMERIRADSTFAEKEATTLLARCQRELERGSWRRLLSHLLQTLRRQLVRCPLTSLCCPRSLPPRLFYCHIDKRNKRWLS